MVLAILEALAALVVILAGCELFTNGIEWLGCRLNLSPGAVGSVLAAVGTALPETLVPIVALVFVGGAAARDIGVGAILGAPFMLATLAFAVTGLAAWAFRGGRPGGTRLAVDARSLSQDLRYFFVVYLLAIGASFVLAALRAQGALPA
jgi:cation:H+ antiporter